MNKLVIVVYNEALDDEVMDALKQCSVNSYTKINGVFGKGSHSGAHLGNDIWPGRNHLLQIVCDDKPAKELLACVKELRKRLGLEGIKAFLLPVEELT
ncbi:MAG: PG0541 family transporter-associated protein [Candidatus Omnitrophota bacterium]